MGAKSFRGGWTDSPRRGSDWDCGGSAPKGRGRIFAIVLGLEG